MFFHKHGALITSALVSSHTKACHRLMMFVPARELQKVYKRMHNIHHSFPASTLSKCRQLGG